MSNTKSQNPSLCDEISAMYDDEGDEDEVAVDAAESTQARRLADALAAGESATLEDDVVAVQGAAEDLGLLLQTCRQNLEEIEKTTLRLRDEKATIQGRLAEESADAEKLRAEKDALDEELRRLGGDAEGWHRRRRDAERAERAKFRLYTNLTGVEFDPDAPKDSVRGVAVLVSGVEEFEFNAKEMSGFDVTNALWELLDEDR